MTRTMAFWVFCVFLAGSTWADGIRGVVTAIDVQGKVEVSLDEGKSWHPVRQGQRLSPGSSLRTGPHSRLALLLADRTQVRLNQDTRLDVEEVDDKSRTSGQTKFRQLLGRSWVQSKTVPHALSLRTPTATAGIRGTDWEMEVDEDGRSLLTVMSGEVDFANDRGQVRVAANEQARAVAGQAPVKMRVLNPRERMQWVSAYVPTPLRHIDLTPYAVGQAPAAPGFAAAARNRWAEAAQSFGAALQADPHSRMARTGLALAALHARDTALARAHLAALPGPDDELEACVRIAHLVETRDIAAAVAGLDSLAGRQDLAQPAAWLIRADVMAYEGRIDDGIATLDSGLVRFPAHPRLLALKAYLLWLADKPAQAQSHAAAAVAADPDHVEALLAQGEIARREGDARLAYARFDRAISLYPEEDRAWFGRGLADSEREYVETARTDLARALTLDPKGNGYQGELGSLETFANNFGAAEVAFAAALEDNPVDYVAFTGRGLLRLKQGRPDLALEDFLAAGVMEPRYARAQVYAAVAYYQLGYRPQAGDALARAAQLDPRDPMPHLLAAALHSDRLAPAEAIDAAREALRLLPYLKSLNQIANDQRGSANLGQAFALSGMEEWAASYAQESYDPFWAGSHLFLADRYQGLFTKNSELFQGLLADPTVFGASNRFQSLVPAPTRNGALSLRHTQRRNMEGLSPQVELSGYQIAPVPHAYYLGYEHVGLDHDSGPYNLGVVTAALGLKPRHDLGLFLFLDRAREDDDSLRRPEASLDDALLARRGDLGLHYAADPDTHFWFKTGHFSSDEQTNGLLDASYHDSFLLTYIPLDDAPIQAATRVTQTEFALRQSFRTGAGHLFSLGLEHGRRTTRSQVDTEVFAGFWNQVSEIRHREKTLDLSISDSFNVGRNVTVQADLVWQRQDRDATLEITDFTLGIPSFNDASQENRDIHQFSPRLGLVYRFAPSRLVRAAYQNWVRPAGFSSLAPVATAGIPLDDRMVRRGGELDRLRGQVEWELTPRVFTAGFVDFRRIDNHAFSIRPFTVGELESLDKLRPRDLSALMRDDLLENREAPEFEKGRIDSVGAAFNLMAGRHWSLTGRYTLADSRNTGTSAPGRALPYIPRHTLAGGATWVEPGGWTFTGLLVHRSERYQDEANTRRLRPGLDAAFDLFWQSPDKHWLLRLSADHLIDRTAFAQYTLEANYRF